jgi:hypothetical protein
MTVWPGHILRLFFPTLDFHNHWSMRSQSPTHQLLQTFWTMVTPLQVFQSIAGYAKVTHWHQCYSIWLWNHSWQHSGYVCRELYYHGVPSRTLPLLMILMQGSPLAMLNPSARQCEITVTLQIVGSISTNHLSFPSTLPTHPLYGSTPLVFLFTHLLPHFVS